MCPFCVTIAFSEKMFLDLRICNTCKYVQIGSFCAVAILDAKQGG